MSTMGGVLDSAVLTETIVYATVICNGTTLIDKNNEETFYHWNFFFIKSNIVFKTLTCGIDLN